MAAAAVYPNILTIRNFLKTLKIRNKMKTYIINIFKHETRKGNTVKKSLKKIKKQMTKNLSDFKTCFFPPQNVAISKLFFLPSWKCGDLVFFLENFRNARFTMYVFMGDFSTDFRHKN